MTRARRWRRSRLRLAFFDSSSRHAKTFLSLLALRSTRTACVTSDSSAASRLSCLLEGDLIELFAAPDVDELAALEDELQQFVPSIPNGPSSDGTDALFHSVIGPLTTLRFASDQIGLAVELAPAALGRQQDETVEVARAEAAAAGAPSAAQVLLAWDSASPSSALAA